MDKAQLVKMAITAKPSAGFTVASVVPVVYPYDNPSTSRSIPAAGLAVNVQSENGGKTATNTVVVLCFKTAKGGMDYATWCGDRLLEGKIPQENAQTRAEASLSEVGLVNPGLVSKMLAHWDSVPDNERCNFWALWRKDQTVCAHVSHALNHLQTTDATWLDQLSVAYNDTFKGAVEPGAAGVLKDCAVLTEYAFRVPMLFEGDRGSGKTHDSRAFARNRGYGLVEVGGNEGIEAADLLGFLVPHTGASLIWKDGPMAKAFRAASKGEKVVLLLDELLRIPQRHLSILLSALSPDQGMYRLNTGRIVSVDDGVGTEEVLSAPIENLCVVATTNVGSEFAVDLLDPAVAERFVIFRKDTEIGKLTAVLKEQAVAKGFAEAIAKKCIEFYVAMGKLKVAGSVNRIPTVRTLSRVIELAGSEADVKRQVTNQVLLWIDRNSDGVPVKEQADIVDKAINRIFG